LPAQRLALALRWGAFGIGALAACCVTPYGWGSILASLRILGLGELLHLIQEWRPATFSEIDPFALSILGLLGAALHYGARLPAPRIVLVLGLLHMALSHVRNLELFALLLPLAVLTARNSNWVATGRSGCDPDRRACRVDLRRRGTSDHLAATRL
jgi:hypothetical protein